jgi:hypothetical protein
LCFIKRLNSNLFYHNLIHKNPSGVAHAGVVGRQRHPAFGSDSDISGLEGWGIGNRIFGRLQINRVLDVFLGDIPTPNFIKSVARIAELGRSADHRFSSAKHNGVARYSRSALRWHWMKFPNFSIAAGFNLHFCGRKNPTGFH